MSEEIAAAVRSLEASRMALATVLANAPRSRGRPGAEPAGPAASAAGLWEVLWDSASEAAGEHWRRGRVRASLELARPTVEEVVRRQPWTAVAVAGLCGAIVVWVVSTRRRLIFSAARLWWRTAGMTILASTAFNLYERYVGANRAAPSSNEAEPVQED